MSNYFVIETRRIVFIHLMLVMHFFLVITITIRIKELLFALHTRWLFVAGFTVIAVLFELLEIIQAIVNWVHLSFVDSIAKIT